MAGRGKAAQNQWGWCKVAHRGVGLAAIKVLIRTSKAPTDNIRENSPRLILDIKPENWKQLRGDDIKKPGCCMDVARPCDMYCCHEGRMFVAYQLGGVGTDAVHGTGTGRLP
jgi:hypothetical protein